MLADPQYVRAWPGGSGYAKMGSNYAPTLFAQQKAESLGCQQCLWLFGPNEEITEVGTMNIFVLLRKESTSQTNCKSYKRYICCWFSEIRSSVRRQIR